MKHLKKFNESDITDSFKKLLSSRKKNNSNKELTDEQITKADLVIKKMEDNFDKLKLESRHVKGGTGYPPRHTTLARIKLGEFTIFTTIDEDITIGQTPVPLSKEQFDRVLDIINRLENKKKNTNTESGDIVDKFLKN